MKKKHGAAKEAECNGTAAADRGFLTGAGRGGDLPRQRLELIAGLGPDRHRSCQGQQTQPPVKDLDRTHTLPAFSIIKAALRR